MKPVVIVLTVLAVLSFLYFWFVGFTSFLRARSERKRSPSPGPFWLPADWSIDSYTDHGKDLMLRFYRSWFFCAFSAVVMVLSASAFVDLPRDAVRPPMPPAILGVIAVVFATALLAFLGIIMWLVVALVAAWRQRVRAPGAVLPSAHRQRIAKSLQWVGGSLVVFIVSLTLLRNT